MKLINENYCMLLDEEIIYKVYENKQLNKLIDTDEQFKEIIEDIDRHNQRLGK